MGHRVYGLGVQGFRVLRFLGLRVFGFEGF